MCDKLPYCNTRRDKCLIEILETINRIPNIRTLASCCGHQKYNPTIIIKDKKGNIFEFFSKIKIKAKKRNRYYKKDDEGFYFIPELIHLTPS